MRKYFQTLSRMLYLRSKPKITVKTPTVNSLTTSTIPQVKEPERQDSSLENIPKSIDKVEEVKENETRKVEYRSTFDQMFRSLTRNAYKPKSKVTIFGAGDLGMATVFALLAKGITNDVSIIDFHEDKLKAELMDLQFGSKFLPNVKLRASKDYEISSESKICILAPCSDSDIEDEYVDPIQVNAEVFKAMIPQILKYSPNTIFLVAVNPVDVFSYLTWQVSELPKNRVMGTGTNLYTATFQYLLANRLGVAPSDCHGFIIGENGYSCGNLN
ncbi:unnamed protein product [Diatraea saccharalis]|uniref:Lactate/malate dehydrogenase N-terminal domain-containing protein n=1 Tax=Diatraea saccharalis TaxID=40085 RepID=A0A9N9QPF1_9NEOP|nr:unnamed protein product [Diatraea saccharalis]